MKRNRLLALIMLPMLAAYMFQATQYARAPVKYNFYVVYAKNADIALVPGSDLSPNGATLLQNSSAQAGLYNLSLGQWGPGYSVNYTDAMNVTNNQVFAISMIGFNFSGVSTGAGYLKIYMLNDTDADGYGDTEVAVWNGTDSVLTATNYLYFAAAPSYGSSGGTTSTKIRIQVAESGIDFGGSPSLSYEGTMYFWFTSV